MNNNNTIIVDRYKLKATSQAILGRYISKAIAIALLALCICFPAYAFLGVSPKTAVTVISTFVKHHKALPDDEIVRLSNIAKQSGGTKIVGKELGKLNLPNDALEDAYMRIAIHRAALQRQEAEGMFSRLRGTPGFRSTLSKIIGASDIKTSGHLNELRIADNASQHGIKVKGIGVRFNDGKKQGDTDIDVLLEMGKRKIAIEAKDYLPTTPIPLDKFRADMISLAQYAKQESSSKVIKVFSITKKPNDALALKILEKEADKHGVELIFGSPEQQVIQIQQLQKIL